MPRRREAANDQEYAARMKEERRPWIIAKDRNEQGMERIKGGEKWDEKI